MDKIVLPEEVRKILTRFDEAGYSAYAVGGCVRDSLMGKVPSDWDIATNARPENTSELFSDKKIIETGIKHGTVTLILDGEPFEITTFRHESGYFDNRRPKSVDFLDNIREDLCRRDFSVNAMAYNEKEGLLDLFGGKEDIKNKIIRCVGKADKRFSEDALRIMRAIRFSAALGFSAEAETEKSIRKNKGLLLNISKERIYSELKKTVLSSSPGVLYRYKDVFSLFFPDAEKARSDIGDIILSAGDDFPERFAAYLISIGMENKAKEALKGLKADNKTIRATENIILAYQEQNISSKKDIRRLVGKYSAPELKKGLTLRGIFGKNSDTDLLVGYIKEIEEKGLCCRIGDLAVDGDDIIALGAHEGKMTGKILSRLLYDVIEERAENERDLLIAAAKRYIEEIVL